MGIDDKPKNNNNKRIKLNKSQTQSPQKPKPAPNPFKNTNIPKTNPFDTAYSHVNDYEESDSETDDDEFEIVDIYRSPSSKLLSHNMIKSQPSTPIRSNHSNDKRLAPQSQSAKKLKNKSPFQRYANDKMRSMHMSPNKLLSPPPSITILPNLQSSQESEAYSPRSPNKKRDCISIPVQNTNYYQFDAAKTKIFKQKKFWIQLFEENDVWKSLLFAIFGFFIGFIVCSSVKATDKIINGHIVDICTCDIAQNKSTALCNPCIDQYWSLESKYNECNAENVQIKRQCDEILNGQRQSNDIFMINE